MDIKDDTGSASALDAAGAALGFAACGSEPRLAVLRLLVRAGEEGLSVGEIRQRSGFPASTLAHHLGVLAAGGLVTRERRGRAVISRAAFRHVEALAAFLLDECCADARIPHPGHGARRGEAA